MSTNLRIMMLIVAILLFISVFIALKKGRMPLKYSLVWLFPDIILLLISCAPLSLWKFTELIGFQTVSNLVVGIFILMLFFITISLTIIVSGQNTKITLLIQEISLLKEKVREKNNNN
ncbi:DUF2304 domain-containing protein [uncultured Traorella sp.]|uniref:DUF2304 domain-containing protein n=1 Tax=uncultured Traorella sp. TaxID=1929048 RepID=UPI0025DCBABF|nr:DUF2304 domain-containing protein [uncultured Traorella sp.]